MKRDLELVRLLLIATEEASEPINASNLAGNPYSLNEIGYHVDMLVAHGLLDAKTQKSWGGSYVSVVINALTWDGCDYLAAIKSDHVWSKACRVIKETVGTTTLAVIKQTAEQVALAAIQSAL